MALAGVDDMAREYGSQFLIADETELILSAMTLVDMQMTLVEVT
jgi:hypothetical protein